MSHALTALALLYIDAREGEWVSVSAIAFHLGVSEQRVRDVLDPHVAAGKLHAATQGGKPCYGIHVEGVDPAVSPSTSAHERTQ